CIAGRCTLAARQSLAPHLLHPPIVLHPAPEPDLARIRDGARQPAVLDQVAYLQTFQGDQVARRDERVRLCAGERLALPLEVHVPSWPTRTRPCASWLIDVAGAAKAVTER